MNRLSVRLALLGLLVVVKAIAVDRIIGLWRSGAGPAPMRMMEVIDAPIERVWEVVVDIPLQVEWLREMKSVTVTPAGPARVGTKGAATVRILGISVSDEVEVTVVEPPHAYAIRHDGLFAGGGVITLEAGADGTTTVVRWVETLIPPFLPNLFGILQAPILQRIFQDDLHRLKALVETGAVD
jgi:uncharacterized protein YndB with AHSA1/START domain